jgi:hypothetical protein
MPFDAFIAHAFQDQKIARQLAHALRARDWSVWFDEDELKVGDDLVAAINRGVAESYLQIFILSPAFFENSWPRRELKLALGREFREGRKLMVPVWHEVDSADIARYSPELAGRLAISTSEGLPAVVDALIRAREHSLDLLEPGQIATAASMDGRAVGPDDLARRAFDISVVEIGDELIAQLLEQPALVYQLTPRRFEELVAELYSKAGFEVELTPASGDGGVDLYAMRHDELGSGLIVVQAKRYKPELKVGVGAVRELFGTVNLTRASAGVLVTTSTFQSGAHALADEYRWRLSLKDYARLQQLLKTAVHR